MMHSFEVAEPSKPNLRTKTARTLGLWRAKAEDETDRMPSSLRVTHFDMFCYIFSTLTYVLDIFLDLIVAFLYYQMNRLHAALLTLAFIIIPSLILNAIAISWFIDDLIHRKRIAESSESVAKEDFIFIEELKKPGKSGQKGKVGIEAAETDGRVGGGDKEMCMWITAAVCQVAPVLWYWRAIHSAYLCLQLQHRPRRERLLHLQLFQDKVFADRDSAVLRFFEATLEAMPQLLLQAYFLTLDWQRFSVSGQPFAWKWRVSSMGISLASIAYSFVAHHRVLRISLSHKQNLKPTECYLIYVWRLCTVAARFLCLTLFVFCSPLLALLCIPGHALASLLHILLLQRVRTGTNFDWLDRALVGINTWVHIFAPFNMSEGPTRVRYLVAYSVEVLEAIVIIATANFVFPPMFAYQEHLSTIAAALYMVGFGVMISYHWRLHPRLSVKRAVSLKANDVSIKSIIIPFK